MRSVFYLAYELRWDFATPADFQKQRLALVIPVIICKLLLLYSFGQFRSILSYFGLADFGGVSLAMITVSAMMLGLSYESAVTAAPPRGVILMDFVLSVAVISAFRLFLRVVRTWTISGQMRPGLEGRRICSNGAGAGCIRFSSSTITRKKLAAAFTDCRFTGRSRACLNWPRPPG
jgi:FlaA1/EpsC-like NDP-sugar epimerase